MVEEGYLDFDRVLVLRTASNYSMPPNGESVLKTIGDESTGTNAALEAAYRVGSVVADELLKHWDRYENTIPAN